MIRVLLAPDKFKGSLTAAEVADHLSRGMRSVRTDLDIIELPIADGGDGTVAAAVGAGYRAVPVMVDGPTGVPVRTSFARHGDRAVVELADACGLVRLPDGRPEPLQASSFGLGQVILAAVRAGARTVVIGVGGSASTDGGAGLLQALGARILDAAGNELPRGGGALLDADRLELDGLDPAVRSAQFLLASDVDNPLLGPTGAAAVYGPQKGADVGAVALLDRALARWAAVVGRAVPGADPDVPGAGAAGGVGFGALAALGAQSFPGIELVLELAGFAQQLDLADLVVIGEGSLDAQTLQGKGPAGVAAAARVAGRPVIAVAGRVELSRDQLGAAGIGAVYALLDLEPDPVVCMARPGPLLERIGAMIAGGLPRSDAAGSPGTAG